MTEKLEDLQGLSLILALFFLISIPTVFAAPVIRLIELACFLLAGFVAWRCFKLDLKIYSTLFLAAAVVYAPIFWLLTGVDTLPILDAIAGIVTIIIAASLSHLLEGHQSQTAP